MAQLVKKIRTELGDLQIDYNALANLPKSDTTLAKAGSFADAKTTGDKIKETNTKIDNLANGTTTAPAMDITDLSADSLNLDGDDVKSYDLTMGSVASGKVLSPQGAINLAHSHAVIVNDDGTITLGEVSSKGGNFKIADTKAYKDGVSAAFSAGEESVTLTDKGWTKGGYHTVEASNGRFVMSSFPAFYSRKDSAFSEDHKMNVYFHTTSDIVEEPLVTTVVDASSVYQSGYEKGQDDADGSSVTSIEISRNGDDSYNSSTYNTDIHVKAVTNNGISGTQVFTVSGENAYSAGDSAGFARVTVPDDGITREVTDTYNSSDHSTTIHILATASNGASGKQSFTVSGQAAYNAGYSAGSNSGSDVGFSTFSAGNGSLTAKLTNDKTNTYTFTAGTPTSEHAIPITVASGSKSATVMTVDASDVYASGASGVSVSNVSGTMTDFLSNKNATIKTDITLSNGTTVSRSVPVDATLAWTNGETAGIESVDFASFSAGNGYLTPKLTNDKTATYSFSIGTATSDNKIPISVGSGDGGSGAAKLMDVDASGIYQSGYSAGETDGVNSLDFYAGGYESVAELDYGESVSITATTTKNDGSSVSKGILVKAPANNYNSGWNACRNNMTAVSCIIPSSTITGELFYANGQSAGTGFYRGTQTTLYTKPASK